ncbi:MAG TPA: hypothetical protein VFW09_22155 [Solirubrobacteraceae bacterium]|nr:hypothetical protein [Solirubrobacteraceae bacterium]
MTGASGSGSDPMFGTSLVIEVRHGVVQQIGIANSSLTHTRAAQRRLLSGVHP